MQNASPSSWPPYSPYHPYCAGIGGCGLGDAGLASIGSCCPQLRSLYAANLNSITAQGCRDLLQVGCSGPGCGVQVLLAAAGCGQFIVWLARGGGSRHGGGSVWCMGLEKERPHPPQAIPPCTQALPQLAQVCLRDCARLGAEEQDQLEAGRKYEYDGDTRA